MHWDQDETYSNTTTVLATLNGYDNNICENYNE